MPAQLLVVVRAEAGRGRGRERREGGVGGGALGTGFRGGARGRLGIGGRNSPRSSRRSAERWPRGERRKCGASGWWPWAVLGLGPWKWRRCRSLEGGVRVAVRGRRCGAAGLVVLVSAAVLAGLRLPPWQDAGPGGESARGGWEVGPGVGAGGGWWMAGGGWWMAGGGCQLTAVRWQGSMWLVAGVRRRIPRRLRGGCRDRSNGEYPEGDVACAAPCVRGRVTGGVGVLRWVEWWSARAEGDRHRLDREQRGHVAVQRLAAGDHRLYPAQRALRGRVPRRCGPCVSRTSSLARATEEPIWRARTSR